MSERKVIDYVLTYANAGDTLLADGWQPWGSPFESNDNYLAYQAFVKYEPEPTPPTPNSQLLTLLSDALNVLIAEASHHERLILALEHAQRRGYVTTALVELEKAHQLDREAIVLRAKQEGWVK